MTFAEIMTRARAVGLERDYYFLDHMNRGEWSEALETLEWYEKKKAEKEKG